MVNSDNNWLTNSTNPNPISIPLQTWTCKSPSSKSPNLPTPPQISFHLQPFRKDIQAVTGVFRLLASHLPLSKDIYDKNEGGRDVGLHGHTLILWEKSQFDLEKLVKTGGATSGEGEDERGERELWWCGAIEPSGKKEKRFSDLANEPTDIFYRITAHNPPYCCPTPYQSTNIWNSSSSPFSLSIYFYPLHSINSRKQFRLLF